MHLLGYVEHRIKTGEGIHAVSNAHDPCCAVGPTADSVKAEDDAGVVELAAHGQYDDTNDGKAGYRENQAHLCPFSKVALGYRKDGDH
jgi:hypothetical protein